jgi:hypothetical protein
MANLGGGSINLVDTFTQSTSSANTAGTSTIMAVNSARKFALIRNMSPTAADVVYLSFGSATATNAMYPLRQYETYTINTENLYFGQVKALASSSGAVTVSITEAK